MFKQFLKESFIYTIGNILIRGVSYFLLPFYTSVLVPTDFGITDILLLFTSFSAIIVSFEVVQGLIVFYTNCDDEQVKKAYASTALWFALAAYSIFGIVCLIWAEPFSTMLFGQPGRAFIFQLNVFSMLGFGLSYVTVNQLRYDHKPREYALVGLITSVMTIAPTILLVLFLKQGANGVIAGQMIGNISGAALAVYLGRKSYSFHVDWVKLRTMLLFSIPLVPSNVGSLVMVYINRVAINSIMSLADVGIYGVAYRVTSIIEVIMMGFRTALPPLIYDNFDKQDTPKEIVRIFNYFASFSLLFILFLSLFSDEIVHIFTHPAYYSAARIIPVMACAYAFGQVKIFSLGWAIVKKPQKFAIINILGAALAIVLNYVLIPHMGILGAAWASLITNAVAAVALINLSQTYYYVPFQWKNLFLASGLFFLIVVVSELIPVEFNLLLTILINLCLLAVGAASLVLFKLIKTDDITLLIKKARLYLAKRSF